MKYVAKSQPAEAEPTHEETPQKTKYKAKAAPKQKE